MTMATSFVYFYVLPSVVLAQGDTGFFGMYMTRLMWTHWAVMIYAVGAGAAFFIFRRQLTLDPARPQAWDSDLNRTIYLALWAIAGAGVLAQFLLGKLNLTGSATYELATDQIGEFAFLAQAYNLMVPLMVVFAIKDNFRKRTWFLSAIVFIVFLQAGFRFRIMILLAGLGTSFVLLRRYRPSTMLAVAGLAVALILSNLIGTVRRYGQGIDLAALSNVSVDRLSLSVDGELGVVYVLDYIADNPLPDLAPLEPWRVGIARLVPSFIWPGKPTAEYTKYFITGTTLQGADKAGIAATQHVEMLLQWGWFGLGPLSFLYFSTACLLLSRMHKLDRTMRVAGSSIVPAYFGFYMQTRGYFSQILADAIFMLAPLYFLNWHGSFSLWTSPRRAAGTTQ
jgi:hypothetical protein